MPDRIEKRGLARRDFSKKVLDRPAARRLRKFQEPGVLRSVAR